MTKKQIKEIADQHARGETADFSNMNLGGANLSGHDWSNALFVNSKLQGANLSDCNLAGADFTGADLSFAYLNNSDCTGANFTKSVFSETNVYKTILKKATLFKAKQGFMNLQLSILE